MQFSVNFVLFDILRWWESWFFFKIHWVSSLKMNLCVCYLEVQWRWDGDGVFFLHCLLDTATTAIQDPRNRAFSVDVPLPSLNQAIMRHYFLLNQKAKTENKLDKVNFLRPWLYRYQLHYQKTTVLVTEIMMQQSQF